MVNKYNIRDGKKYIITDYHLKRKPRFLKKLGFTAEITNYVDNDILNECGVYIITFKGSERIYIGSTIQNLGQRRKEHFNELCAEKHGNPIVSHAFKKYGGKMSFEVIESFRVSTKDEIRCLEQKYLDKYCLRDDTYNINPSANGGREPTLSDDTVFEMFSLRSKGIYNREIADKFGVSSTFVGQIINRKIYNNVYIPKRYLREIEDRALFKGGHRHSLKFKCVYLRASEFKFKDINNFIGIKGSLGVVKNFKPRSNYERFVHKIALDFHGRKISDKQIDTIYKLKAQGVEMKTIAKMVGISEGGLHNRLSSEYQEKKKNGYYEKKRAIKCLY